MDVRVLIRPKAEDTVQEVVVSGRDEFVLGRGSSSAAPLDGPGISREHVAISLDKSDILITDLSVNGAWINGKRLPQREKYRLKTGDVVELPGYEVSFKLDDRSGENGSGDASPFQRTLTGSRPAAADSLKKTISGFLRSFSFLDRVLIFLAILSFFLVFIYFSLS